MGSLRIEALGGFRVIRDGVAVPLAEWQSKKARDLLKVLLSRRGRPVPRDELNAMLWPTDSHRWSNRLSVVLTTLRSVLGPAAIVSDRDVVRVDLDVVDLDVERFAAQAGTALDAARRGDPETIELLRAAAAAYRGPFCAEDAYQNWAVPLREELAELHTAVLRALSSAASQADEPDLAVQSLLVLLRQDPYDESAYLELVGTLQRAGRYGGARRQYKRYAERMVELDIAPQPFPGSARLNRLTG